MNSKKLYKLIEQGFIQFDPYYCGSNDDPVDEDNVYDFINDNWNELKKIVEEEHSCYECKLDGKCVSFPYCNDKYEAVDNVDRTIQG